MCIRDRGKHYHEIQEIVWRDLPYFWLVETFRDVAFNHDLRDPQYWAGNIAERAYWVKPR